ncbi:MAG: hypothetical protein AVDCRST_MAG15-2547, partial [uncultured Rubellimicrobium sp.]
EDPRGGGPFARGAGGRAGASLRRGRDADRPQRMQLRRLGAGGCGAERGLCCGDGRGRALWRTGAGGVPRRPAGLDRLPRRGLRGGSGPLGGRIGRADDSLWLPGDGHLAAHRRSMGHFGEM